MVVDINHKPVDETINYYNTPTVIAFNDLNYKLSWSAHPNNSYYKQEYAAVGETAEHFNDMILIDFLITELDVKDVAQSQIAMLLARKKTDNVCNYQVMKNEQTGDYILDFVMSEESSNRINIIEWNGYHYKPYTDKAGHKGVLLFGVSHRAYAGNTTKFLRGLSNYRMEVLKKISVYPMPEILVK